MRDLSFPVTALLLSQAKRRSDARKACRIVHGALPYSQPSDARKRSISATVALYDAALRDLLKKPCP